MNFVHEQFLLLTFVNVTASLTECQWTTLENYLFRKVLQKCCKYDDWKAGNTALIIISMEADTAPLQSHWLLAAPKTSFLWNYVFFQALWNCTFTSATLILWGSNVSCHQENSLCDDNDCEQQRNVGDIDWLEWFWIITTIFIIYHGLLNRDPQNPLFQIFQILQILQCLKSLVFCQPSHVFFFRSLFHHQGIIGWGGECVICSKIYIWRIKNKTDVAAAVRPFGSIQDFWDWLEIFWRQL